MTLWMLVHVFPRDRAPVLLSGRLTEGLKKDHSLGVREPGCLARLSVSHFDSRKVIFHISECQFHPFHRISSGCCRNKEMLRTYLP